MGGGVLPTSVSQLSSVSWGALMASIVRSSNSGIERRSL